MNSESTDSKRRVDISFTETFSKQSSMSCIHREPGGPIIFLFCSNGSIFWGGAFSCRLQFSYSLGHMVTPRALCESINQPLDTQKKKQKRAL